MSTTTEILGLSLPADGDTDWGGEIRTDLQVLEAAVGQHQFAQGTHSALSFALRGGRVRYGTTVTEVEAGTIALADDDVSVVEVDPADGTVYAVTGGPTAGRVPLYEVQTASGAISAVVDLRTGLAGIAPSDLGLTSKGDLLVCDGSGLGRLPAGGDGQVLTVDSAQTLGVKWASASGGGSSGALQLPQTQGVLQGYCDSSGVPAYLVAGTGLAVDLVASSTPLRVAFAAGFDEYGVVSYLGTLDSDSSGYWSSLPSSDDVALYIDRDTGTGALTAGYTMIAPVYSPYPPASPSTGQHWFDVHAMEMRVWSGSAWSTVQRVFVGAAHTDSSSVVRVTIPPLRYDWIARWADPDTRPTLPSRYDDEFDDDTLDPKWAWLNQGGASAVEAMGALRLVTPFASGVNLRCLVQTAPTGDFTVTIKTSPNLPIVSYKYTGLIGKNTSTGKLLGWGGQSRANVLGLGKFRWTNETTYSAESLVSGVGNAPYIRIVKTGTNLELWWSFDGIGWVRQMVEAIASWVEAVNQVGVYCDNHYSDSGDCNPTFYWFRVTEP